VRRACVVAFNFVNGLSEDAVNFYFVFNDLIASILAHGETIDKDTHFQSVHHVIYLSIFSDHSLLYKTLYLKT